MLRIRYGAKRPVDCYAFADLRNELRSDDFEIIFTHDLERAVVCGECVVEPSRWGVSETDSAKRWAKPD